MVAPPDYTRGKGQGADWNLYRALANEDEKRVFRDFIASLYDPKDQRKGPRTGKTRAERWVANRDRLLAEDAARRVAANGGSENEGSQAGGSEAGGSEAGGSEAGGSEAGGSEAGGSEAGGPEPGETGKANGADTSKSPATKKKRSAPEPEPPVQPRTKKPRLGPTEKPLVPERNILLFQTLLGYLKHHKEQESPKVPILWKYAKTLEPDSFVRSKSVYLIVGLEEGKKTVQHHRAFKLMEEQYFNDHTIDEFNVQKALKSVPCPQILKFYGMRQLEAEDGSRAGMLSLEYAPFRTLRQVIIAHQAAQHPIPEHFIWYVFNELLTALATLEQLKITHVSLKPENVFLCDAGEKPDYPAYKSIKLGDFESSVIVKSSKHHRKSAEDLETETDESSRLNWGPPELANQDIEPYLPRSWALDTATDIFCLGLLIREMMLCSTTSAAEHDELRAFEIEGYRKEREPVPITELKCPDQYSVGLVGMVAGCLKFQKDERRMLADLQRRAAWNLRDWDALLGEQVRNGEFAEDHALFVRTAEADMDFALDKEYVELSGIDTDDEDEDE